MRVLLTNARLSARSGSETYLYDVAMWLRDHGHLPIAYAATLGAFATTLRRDGIAVVDDLSKVAEAPDVIHGQHHIATLTALTVFSGVPAVSFCHGWLPWEELPVRHPQIRRYVAVSDLTRERVVSEGGVDPARVRVVPNFVDTAKFRPRSELPRRPRKALVFSNQAKIGAQWIAEIRAACAQRGISVDVVGAGVGSPIDAPDKVLGRYDLVFARGRAALEALASGVPVVLCDEEGLASFVTPSVFDELLRGNFGVQVLRRRNEQSLLGAEIDRYDPQVVHQVSTLVRTTLSVDVGVPKILAVYEEALADAAQFPARDEDASKAVAEYLRQLDVTSPVPYALSDRGAREEIAALRSGFVLARVMPAIAAVRARVAPNESRRHRAIRRAHLFARAALATPPNKKDGGTGAETATHVPATASLAAVVLDVGGQSGMIDAVRSLSEQVPRPEIVVVSSGWTRIDDDIRAAGLPADVIKTTAHLFPGAARNVGIAATAAPFVAFVAADHIAAPGWAAGRLAAHGAGAQMVSSPVVNDSPNNPFAVAAHTLLLARRLPRTPPGDRLHYGASYDRELFRYFGRFRDDVRIGEDTEFHDRLSGAVSPVYRPDVRVSHANPRSLAALLTDNFGRGRRAAAAHAWLNSMPPRDARRFVARSAVTRMPRSAWVAWRSSGWAERGRLVAASPFLLPAAAAYSVGAAVAPAPTAATAVLSPNPKRLVALLSFSNEARYLPEFLDNVGAQVDGIICLDDGSTDGAAELAVGHPVVLEVLRLSQAGDKAWDEPRNRAILVDAAIRNGAEWVVAVDADERLERDFRSRAEQFMAHGDRVGIRAYQVTIRELWDSPTTYRVDGVWGRKSHARLFRVPEHYDRSKAAFHGFWPPASAQLATGGFASANLVVYHLAMIGALDREARKLKYHRLDPESRWQKIGYDYLTDETGLKLERIVPEREYFPLPPG